MSENTFEVKWLGPVAEAGSFFLLWKRKIEVKERMDHWSGSDHEYYKVRGGDDAVYILKHDFNSDQWELTMKSLVHDKPID